MLIHIRPMMLSWYTTVLLDLDLHPFGLHLVGGKDLTEGRPYPNRRYTVACAKERRKIMDGILIETNETVDRFRATARWGIDIDDGRLITNIVDYEITDRDFDAVSDNTVLWLAQWETWEARWDDHKRPSDPYAEEETSLQTHYFPMPTLQRERFAGPLAGKRFPRLAFRL